MLRTILGVVVGYVAIVAVVFIGMTIAWTMLGAEAAYQPGVWDISTTWIGLSLVVSVVAAIIGGMVCKAISRSTNAPIALVVLVLVLGGVGAVFVALAEKPATPEPRPAEISMQDAMTKSQQPLWVAIANPLIGAVGVLIGAGLIKGRGNSPS